MNLLTPYIAMKKIYIRGGRGYASIIRESRIAIISIIIHLFARDSGS